MYNEEDMEILSRKIEMLNEQIDLHVVEKLMKYYPEYEEQIKLLWCGVITEKDEKFMQYMADEHGLLVEVSPMREDVSGELGSVELTKQVSVHSDRICEDHICQYY